MCIRDRFGALIFIHELGHFLTAKWSGIKVNEFSIGMGPKLWGWQRGETLYALRLLPIGGYVSMEGEDEESNEPRAFQRAAVWKRIIVTAAGAVMNLALGFIAVSYTHLDVYKRQTLYCSISRCRA